MDLPREASETFERLALFGIRPGLESTRTLLRALGNPQDSIATVLVAGTNGKGSTAALLAAVVSAAGYRCGLFSSPHLESVRERVRIDGVAIGGERLAELLREVMLAAERALPAPPTYFEALTCLALCHFAASEARLSVLEVGLGGRLDATNVCSPLLSVITPVALDHRRQLGESEAAIAGEKAGILRPDRPALAAVGGEAEVAIRERAREIGARLVLRRERLRDLRSTPRAGGGQRVELRTDRDHHGIELGLPGVHQAENLALAVLAAEELAERGFERLDADAIRRGVAACRWPGRLERVDLPEGRSVLFDGAHNPHAARALARHLADSAPGRSLVFGVLDDKEVDEMLPPLFEVAGDLWLTTPAGRRGRAPDSYRELWSAARGKARVSEPASRALFEALAEPGAQVVVAGSLHLVGELRQVLRERYGVPPPATDPLFRAG